MKRNEHYLQSPMDDFFSFYFVTQWAAVFNNHEFNKPQRNLPKDLREFREKLFTDGDIRDSVTSSIQNINLTPVKYGQFLSKCGPFLSEWYGNLHRANNRWTPRLEDLQSSANPPEVCTDMFEELISELVLDALKLYDKQLSSLS